jgi:maleylpyruvate isomerase
MGRSLEDARRWVREGTNLAGRSLAELDDFTVDTALPGWSRAHLVAHLAANAEAVGNLVHWAATGERTPMYSSPGQRAADIERASRRSRADLVDWFGSSAAALDRAMDALTDDQWGARVVTAQGRDVPASETPWMRAREVMVHAVDLHAGVTFDDLPADFLDALVEDVLVKRGVEADAVGPLAGRAAYLTGRADGATAGVTALDGSAAPDLPPWL